MTIPPLTCEKSFASACLPLRIRMGTPFSRAHLTAFTTSSSDLNGLAGDLRHKIVDYTIDRDELIHAVLVITTRRVYK
jgi:hypothetical protein